MKWSTPDWSVESSKVTVRIASLSALLSRSTYDIVTFLVELGFTENQSMPNSGNQITSPTLAIYKDNFELQFLQDTEQFYRLEAATFLVHNSVTEYLKKVWFSLSWRRGLNECLW